jgi:hypothetical protein
MSTTVLGAPKRGDSSRGAAVIRELSVRSNMQGIGRTASHSKDPELVVGPIPSSDTRLAIAYTGLLRSEVARHAR